MENRSRISVPTEPTPGVLVLSNITLLSGFVLAQPLGSLFSCIEELFLGTRSSLLNSRANRLVILSDRRSRTSNLTSSGEETRDHPYMPYIVAVHLDESVRRVLRSGLGRSSGTESFFVYASWELKQSPLNAQLFSWEVSDPAS